MIRLLLLLCTITIAIGYPFFSPDGAEMPDKEKFVDFEKYAKESEKLMGLEEKNSEREKIRTMTTMKPMEENVPNVGIVKDKEREEGKKKEKKVPEEDVSLEEVSSEIHNANDLAR